jgi:hypothetical protein
MKKVCAKMVPKMLSDEQKERISHPAKTNGPYAICIVSPAYMHSINITGHTILVAWKGAGRKERHRFLTGLLVCIFVLAEIPGVARVSR